MEDNWNVLEGSLDWVLSKICSTLYNQFSRYFQVIIQHLPKILPLAATFSMPALFNAAGPTLNSEDPVRLWALLMDVWSPENGQLDHLDPHSKRSWAERIANMNDKWGWVKTLVPSDLVNLNKS
jgi:hypothetical protein